MLMFDLTFFYKITCSLSDLYAFNLYIRLGFEMVLISRNVLIS